LVDFLILWLICKTKQKHIIIDTITIIDINIIMMMNAVEEVMNVKIRKIELVVDDITKMNIKKSAIADFFK